MDFSVLFSKLTLPWAILVLSWIGFYYVIDKMWTRINELTDDRLKISQDFSEKLNQIISQTNSTLQNIVIAFKDLSNGPKN